ncbi:hypothetical protein JXJ21_01855 [candidate division KSB1 bacterium]|nr:hypothetical protein [candidate division KSB1 bacterium]
MKRINRLAFMICAFICLLFMLQAMPVSAKIVFVNINSTGRNNGNSWENAYLNLHNGLDKAEAGDEIWVARGTYKPSSGSNRDLYFKLKTGISLFGGFLGNELDLSERNPSKNATVLSGDIGVPDDSTDNSYCVVKAREVQRACLDGFIISGGNADECG